MNKDLCLLLIVIMYTHTSHRVGTLCKFIKTESVMQLSVKTQPLTTPSNWLVAVIMSYSQWSLMRSYRSVISLLIPLLLSLTLQGNRLLFWRQRSNLLRTTCTSDTISSSSLLIVSCLSELYSKIWRIWKCYRSSQIVNPFITRFINPPITQFVTVVIYL